MLFVVVVVVVVATATTTADVDSPFVLIILIAIAPSAVIIAVIFIAVVVIAITAVAIVAIMIAQKMERVWKRAFRIFLRCPQCSTFFIFLAANKASGKRRTDGTLWKRPIHFLTESDDIARDSFAS